VAYYCVASIFLILNVYMFHVLVDMFLLLDDSRNQTIY